MRQDVKNQYLPIEGLTDDQNKRVGEIIDEIQVRSRNDAIRGYNRMLKYLEQTVGQISQEIKDKMWDKFHKPLNN
jgi:hypothetical protein